MEPSTSSNAIPFHRGLRCFGNNMNSHTLLFIHDLDSWSIPRLREIFNSKFPNSSALISSIKKLFSPKFGSYFIIKVNNSQENLSFFNLLLSVIKGLPVTSKIRWSISNRIPKKLKSKRKCNLDAALNPLSLDFFTNYLSSSSTLFNLCVSWNINGWNIEKRDSVLYLSKIFNQFVSAYKKLVITNLFL